MMIVQNKQIKCKFCGYEFKTHSKIEEKYDYEDRVPYKEKVYYPLPSENAHMMGDYCCDTCYKKFPEIIKGKMLESINHYLGNAESRKEFVYNEYMEQLKAIDEKNQKVENIKDLLLSVENIIDLPEEIQVSLRRGTSPCYLIGTSDIDRVIKWEKEHKLLQKPMVDWGKKYDLEIEEGPTGNSKYDWITESEFFDLLLDSKVVNKTPRELLELVSQYKNNLI